MTTQQGIAEKDKGIIDGWYARARQMKADELPAFIKKLTESYGHDYGTICHAIAAAAFAAAMAVEHSPAGGITGFQSGCVFWAFASRWNHWGDEPRMMVDYSQMLYPQYDQEFRREISKETWAWLQKHAAEKLKGVPDPHGAVELHWQSIVAGTVPFGFSVTA